MSELRVERKVRTRIPTADGEYSLSLYTNNLDNKEHLALVMGEVSGEKNVLVRIHSECFTGDVLGSMRCDCGEQLRRAMQHIAAKGAGVLIYLRQEGRGIGLLDKLRAYNLQDEGMDTVEANLALGHQADERDYTIAAGIIGELGVRSVHLLTNNPLKISHLRQLGIPVTRRVPLEGTITADNFSYLTTKAQRMHHMLNLDPHALGILKDGNGSGGSGP
jgi:GTP cyclohydrolase II